jgi:hypothetical protein
VPTTAIPLQGLGSTAPKKPGNTLVISLALRK